MLLQKHAAPEACCTRSRSPTVMDQGRTPGEVLVFIENIREIFYDKHVRLFVQDEKEVEDLNTRYNIDEAINDKITWAEKWMNSDELFGVRLVAFAIVEGLFFTGSFAAIFYLKHLGLMNSLARGNELVARDEQLHFEFACYLHHKIPSELKASEDDILKITKEAYDIEEKFYTKSLNVNIIGMKKDDMQQHIQYTPNNVLESLNCKKLFNVKTPFDFMENMKLNRKTNCFERKPAEYLKVQRKELNFNDL
ncbi:ribonucleoside-diphosphate reductase small chain-like [Solenopsis invicta]|uniref:ribonucleoside-diphosphate reductase small chain-like n=1 Tax=Solenopsis invicta TaxID=13686 RepID=UPI000595C79B|nr:ribonucleoside-diphosphate reductase small chain-like [Solenopsis invicta]